MRWFLAALLLVLAAPPTLAQDPTTEAKALFESGLTHARSGDWAQALAAFQSAYELAPRPSVLFNLAGAQLRNGKLLQAHANYARFLSSKDASLTRAHRKAAEAQQKLLQLRIPRLRVQVDGLRPEDRVLLDKTRLYPNELDMELWVDPGEHVLAVYGENGRQAIRHLVLVEGQHQFVPIQLH